MSENYAIVDLDGYIQEMRLAAAESIAPENTDNLDEYISLNQMKSLVESWCIGHDNHNRPIINEESNINIFEDTVTWISNVGLAKLAAEGLLECAWDNESNDMIFWSPKTKTQTKTQTNDKPKSRPKNKGSERKDT
jgi:hypothetical protein